MKRADVFPSKYQSHSDLNGKPKTLTISAVSYEKLKSPDGKEQSKTVLTFEGMNKTLPLNVTNWDSVATICGDDTDDWVGKEIELYPTKTQMGGKLVDCIRIRAPSRAPRPKQPKQLQSAELDDEVPF